MKPPSIQQSCIGGCNAPGTSGDRGNGLVAIGHCTQKKSVHVETGDLACPH